MTSRSREIFLDLIQWHLDQAAAGALRVEVPPRLIHIMGVEAVAAPSSSKVNPINNAFDDLLGLEMPSQTTAPPLTIEPSNAYPNGRGYTRSQGSKSKSKKQKKEGKHKKKKKAAS